MKRLKYGFRSALGFSRAQARGFVLLGALVLGFVFSGVLYSPTYRTVEDPDAVKGIDSVLACWDETAEVDHGAKAPRLAAEINVNPFRFDPNKLSAEGLQRLGFSPWLAKRMVRYRAAGGVFRIRKDLLRIYGMDTALYRQLEPYIQLPSEQLPAREWQPYPPAATRKAGPFDLNLADTAQLKKIFGIGDKRALRIVAYREKLGGFVSVVQVGEIYTLDSVVAGRLVQASFVSENFRPRRIDINRAGENELAAHPYLSKFAAQALVAYRFQHGEFSAIQDLAKIQVLDTKTIQKIAPYLEFQLYHHPAPDMER